MNKLKSLLIGLGILLGSGFAAHAAITQWIPVPIDPSTNNGFWANALNASGTITQNGVPVGFGTITTSTGLSSGFLPIATGASTIGNSSISQAGGTTFINSVTPLFDGGGDFIGPNIFMGATTTAALGNVSFGGGVVPIMTTTTLTGTQMCSGGFFDVVSTTANITLAVASTSAFAGTTCGSSIVAGGWSPQYLRNDSTHTVTVATTGAGESQVFAPGTPSVLSPGQEYFVAGQFEASSTIQNATTTGMTFVIKYSLLTATIPTSTLIYATSTGAYVGLTIGSGLSLSGSTLTAAGSLSTSTPVSSGTIPMFTGLSPTLTNSNFSQTVTGGNVTGTLQVTATTTIGTATTTFQIFANGHINATGTLPTVSSCGSTPVIRGTDVAGEVTVGTGIVASCTVTFQFAYAAKPICQLTPETAGIASLAYSYTTSTITFTGTSLTGDLVDFDCLANE